MSLYTKAALFSPDSPEIYSNLGVLAEKEGNLTEAVSLYEKALEAKPQDPIAMVLLEEALNKKRLVEDKEKSQRIDTLVAELIKAYQMKKETVSGAEEDKWTSKPKSASLASDFKGRNLQVNL